MNSRQQIIEKTLEILGRTPEGGRYSDLVRPIREGLPHIADNTIHGNVWNLDVKLPDQIFKPARGL